MPHPIEIRPYGERDASATLAIFIDAITKTAAGDYTPAQVRAWARPKDSDRESWHASMQVRNSFVAQLTGEVAGFSNVSKAGYIDMLFVSPRFQRRGIATRLLAEAERRARLAGAPSLWANVSITARPVFEREGFSVEEVQHPSLEGVTLMNFSMRKSLR